ncbi:hypothetical protein RvY_08028 [Ramazzottius varieornatus]|uniref:Uncharacterized protein n=1 Tax=Ramazzottius varieornatus TaxID=947166 RepID=A0A1D1V4F9_RAMVA|nr:hypothetical protein RvY_08028 [Ramazzottius varieornatus]
MDNGLDEANPFWESETLPSSNPFDQDTSESIDNLLVNSGNQTPVAADSALLSSPQDEEKTLTWDRVATFLLKKNFHLTALELHTELHEKGIPLPRLRDFFSNPGNFEVVRDVSASGSEYYPNTGQLNRASSSQTLDSIDFARDPSEDDPNQRVDERVAVLEFELRKARDLIQSLRENLTNLTGNSEVSSTNKAAMSDAPLKRSPTDSSSFAENSAPIQTLERRALNFLINEYLMGNDYKLTSITFTDECMSVDLDDWDDVGLNMPKPPALISLYRNHRSGSTPKASTDAVVPDRSSVPKNSPKYLQADIGVQTDFEYPPEKFSSAHHTEPLKETLTKDLQADNQRLSEEVRVLRNRCEHVENDLRALRSQRTFAPSSHTDVPDSPNMASGDSFSSHPYNQSRRPSVPPHNPSRHSQFEDALKQAVLTSLISTDMDPDNRRILDTISKISLHRDRFANFVAETLPNIIPNVLLSKRQEIVPLLLYCSILHEDHDVRDKLLHQLFNLLKKPEEQQRYVILTGCERYAALSPMERLEGELLPQCWTQISHKYSERRMLVAEACAVLAPYVSPALCGSLIISMLKQMLTEDKNVDVRLKVVQSIAVVCLFIDLPEKLPHLIELLRSALVDSSEPVVQAALHVYLPSLAIWTSKYSELGPRLVEPQFLALLDPNNLAASTLAINGLRKLIPHIYASVVRRGPWKDPEHDFEVDPALVEATRRRLPLNDNPLESLEVLLSSDFAIQSAKFQSYLDREWFQEWPELKFVIDNFIPCLCQFAAVLHATKHDAVIAIVDLFRLFTAYFGNAFATGPLSRCMKGKIQELGSSFLCHAVFVCFACAVVALCEPKQLQEFLASALVSISDQSLTLEGLQLIFKDLCDRFPEDLIQVCWSGIVHHSVPVRLNACRLLRSLSELFHKSYVHLESLIAPLVTLSSDQEPRIRLEIIPSLANILKEHVQEEKILAVFQSFLDDRDHLHIVDESVRALAASASSMDKKFFQEFLLPRLAVLVAGNARLQVYRKDMAVCLLDAYVTLSCSNLGEESWLIAPVMQSLRSLLQELKELGMQEYVDIAQELSDKLNRIHNSASSSSLTNPDEIKTKVMTKIKDSGLTTMFKKK